MNQGDPDEVVQAELSTWTRSAPSYAESTATLTSHAVSHLIGAAHLTSDSRALEVGCGPGHITAMMADTGATVTGVDLVPAMIETARALHPDIEFVEADAEQLCSLPSFRWTRSGPNPRRQRPSRLALPGLTANMCQGCRGEASAPERMVPFIQRMEAIYSLPR